MDSKVKLSEMDYDILRGVRDVGPATSTEIINYTFTGSKDYPVEHKHHIFGYATLRRLSDLSLIRARFIGGEDVWECERKAFVLLLMRQKG